MRLLYIKILSLICSPITWLYLYFSGIEYKKYSYFCGFPFISKKKLSTIKIGKNCKFLSSECSNLMGLNHRCIISTYYKNARLTIGDNCGFSGVTIWCFLNISIGNNVNVGANCTIMDGDAHQNDVRAGKNKEIIIEDNVWIGANCFILKGVHIGENSVIGAGSIVTKNIPENVVAVGNPCRVVKYIK